MYLKKIEVQGFKSFANKILFEFHNGITGIVGPNGSGKSNVSDAVRWVLGEQSAKQLRGGNMQDVIFAGTELKKPQGFAYVAITLDNADRALSIDFDEVKVSRRLYRSGESEYQINGSACRLKDVQEIFYDTGIGKDGYSIIGQGQVDKILNGRPEERRELFDEAAGITKYKRRKTLASKKLESERANLVRIKDILSVLEKQVGPLREQSAKAKEYLRLRDELKHYDVNYFLCEMDAISTRIQSLEEKKQIIEGDVNETKSRLVQLKASYERMEREISNIDILLTSNREKVALSNVREKELFGQIDVLREQVKSEEKNIEHIHTRVCTIDAEISQKQEGFTKFQSEKESIESEQREIEQRKKNVLLALEKIDGQIAKIQEAVEAQKQSHLDYKEKRAKLIAEEQKMDSFLEQVRLRSSEVLQKLLKVKSKESAIGMKREQKMALLSSLKEKLDQLEGQKQTLLHSLHEREEKKVEEEREFSVLQEQVQHCRVKLETLQNIAEHYEGYGNAIRRVMEKKSEGVCGVVADLIESEQKYEQAIETALGGRIQNVVTRDEETAKELILYLKKHRYGRATFLPLTAISKRGSGKDENVRQEEGVLGMASELVRTRSEYQPLIQSLLGNIWVVENIDRAIAMERKYRYELRIVTLDGEQFSPGGAMSGGAFKNSNNLLGRKREIEELENQFLVAKEKWNLQKERLKKSQEEILAIQKQLEQIRSQVQEKLIEKNTLDMDIRGFDQQIEEISHSTKDMEKENRLLLKRAKEIENEKVLIQEDIERIDDQSQGIDQDVQELLHHFDEKKSEQEKTREEMAKIELSLSKLGQQMVFANVNAERVETEKRQLMEEKEGFDESEKGSRDKIATRQKEIENLQVERETLLAKAEKIRELLDKKSREKQEYQSKQKKFFAQHEEIAERERALDKDFVRLTSQLEKSKDDQTSLMKHIWDEYELTKEGAQKLRDENLCDLTHIRKHMEELHKDIRLLGNINVNAIDEYETVFGQYEQMSIQHNDIVEAEKNLLKVIQDLDLGMRQQFAEKFGLIQKEFDAVFKELFGGGHGKLILDEESDILEAEIRIISQPPGKKLQNMMQLSGGEKALTAISLLFAIQNLKPSPFALLDEIEAALDDSNVDRFAKYLHKLTDHTQFIVITHRRGTMVAADRLYGITMQEKGVSTLVSVNLIEDSLT